MVVGSLPSFGSVLIGVLNLSFQACGLAHAHSVGPIFSEIRTQEKKGAVGEKTSGKRIL